MSSRVGICLVGSLAILSQAARGQGGLFDYLQQPDPAFRWEIESNDSTEFGRIYQIALTSQRWHDITWTHQLAVYEPKELKYPDAVLLFITGGSMGRKVKPEDHRLPMALAQLCGARVALLPQVPNQPLLGDRKEDDLITETFIRYLETKDRTWPLLFAMVKSAVRAMDAVQELGRQQGRPVSRFIVTGASKRGWTTWLTGAADERVVAIAPMVIPTLNFQKQIPNQTRTWGRFSEQIEDYVRRGLLEDFNSPEKSELWTMVDPFSYLERLTEPKLQINGTNDRYWTLDSMNLYWDDLKGPKYVLYVPNAGHNLEPNRDWAISTLGAYFRHVISGRPLPKLSWEHSDDADGTLVLAVTSDPAPKRVRWMTARSDTKDFRESKWDSIEANGTGQSMRFTLPRPPSGSIALFADLEYEIDGIGYHLSTQIRQVDPAAGK